jgi:serine/threonine-protein kinase
MGEVRLATDHRLDRLVAVKLLRSELAGQASVRRRFEAEARAAAQVVHPNVVLVLDTGEQDGVPFIVMEQMSGQTLRHALARGPMTPAAAQDLARQVLSALAAAHRAGLVHRDIKPGNILEADEGLWKVADFGIAKSLELADGDLTSVGLVLGTPAYLAPERLSGKPATVASDLYAVGVVLYECLAGRPPFAAESPIALAALVATQRPDPIRTHRPDLPESLAAAIDRAMAADPADRFATAAEMAVTLDPTSTDVIDATTAVGGDLPTPADPTPADPTLAFDVTRPTRAALPVQPLHKADPTIALPAPSTRYRPPQRRTVWAAAIAAGVLVVALVVAVSTTHGPTSAATTHTTPPTTASLTATGVLPAGLDSALRQLEHEVKR